jgi:hypothetical protein
LNSSGGNNNNYSDEIDKYLEINNNDPDAVPRDTKVRCANLEDAKRYSMIRQSSDLQQNIGANDMQGGGFRSRMFD